MEKTIKKDFMLSSNKAVIELLKTALAKMEKTADDDKISTDALVGAATTTQDALKTALEVLATAQAIHRLPTKAI